MLADSYNTRFVTVVASAFGQPEEKSMNKHVFVLALVHAHDALHLAGIKLLES